MDFVALVDQVIALLRQRGRVTYRTLQRQFQLDADALTDLLGRAALCPPGRDPRGRAGHRVDGRRPPHAPSHRDARRAGCTGATDVHPRLSRGEDSHLPQRPRRRAQAGHRAVCRPQRLHGAAGRPRPRRGAAAPRSRAGAHDGGRAPLRGHGQPGHGRRHHGALWGAARP